MITLKSEIKKLTFALKNPRIFVTDYFAELINQLDQETYHYIDKIEKSSNNYKKNTISNCIGETLQLNSTMIEVVKEKEQEILSNITESYKFEEKFESEMYQAIETYQEIFKGSKIDSQTLNDLGNSIYTSFNEIKQILFSNQCFLLLDKEILMELKKTFNHKIRVYPCCNLIFIANGIIGERGLKRLVEFHERSLKIESAGFNLDEHEAIEKVEPNKCYKEMLSVLLLQRVLNSSNHEKIINSVVQSFELEMVEEVHLFSMNFTDIASDLFRFKGTEVIKAVYFNLNYLKQIHKDIFQGLSELEHIDLSRNRIQNLETEVFKNLGELKMINLAYNCLSHIEHKSFSGLNKLTELQLCFNCLNSIDSETFAGLTNLAILNLSNNKLSILNSNCFKGLRNLKELYLNNNHLAYISTSAFENLIKIKKIDLRENNLKDFDWTKFIGLNDNVDFKV